MPRNTPTSLWWRRITVAFLITCAAVDLCPRHGAPDFRYTGSDPAHEVWNLGWPVALAIYDSQSGIHVGPFMYVVIPVQAALVSPIIAFLFFQRRHNKALERSGRVISIS